MNIGKQVKNIGSQATSSAMNKASNVSMGKNRPRNTSNYNVSISAPVRKKMTKGSSAGYRNEKSVRLQSNNTGYLNPANQTARHSRKNLNMISPEFKAPSINNGGYSSDIRSLRSGSGSVKLLQDRL